MRIEKLAPCLLICCLVRAHSLGDEPPPALALFALPKIGLKQAAEMKQPLKTEGESTKSMDAERTEDLSLSVSSGSAEFETSIQVFESMNGEPVLRRVELPDEPAGAIGWIETKIWDPVFAPEVIRVGKVKMTGGIIAAAKRKNPFCLLNPLVFAAGW